MNQRYAGFGVRLVAAVIDGILLSIIIQPIMYLFMIPYTLLTYRWVLVIPGIDTSIIEFWLLSFIFLPALGLLYGYYVFYQKKYGQTVGKKIMKIKVVTYDGKTPTKSTFFLREIIGKFLSAVILGIGYLMVIWNPKKQALHDKLAETYVVYAEPGVQQQAVPTPQQAVPAQQQQAQQSVTQQQA